MSEKTYSCQPFITLVRKYADDHGNVDYAAWHQSSEDMLALDRQVSMLADISPDSHPALFDDQSARRSYWINTYNTLVLQAVLECWPLQSVRDVKISMSSRLIPGKGFFYDRKVVVGGVKTNLYKLENDIIRKQIRDPRIHFALNCASDSCPVLLPSQWAEDDLEAAACNFINNPDNVLIKDDTVWLSRIFKWYKKDFPADLNSYLQIYAQQRLHQQLQNASDLKYVTRYLDYNWAVNDLV